MICKAVKKTMILMVSVLAIVLVFSGCAVTNTSEKATTDIQSETVTKTAAESKKETEVEPKTEETVIRIITTSDLHGKMLPWDYLTDKESASGSLAQAASAIKEKRNENTILIDVGDLIQGNAAELFMNEDVHPMIQELNHIGYDAAIIGNHEFNFGVDTVKKDISTQKAKMLLSNVYDPEGNRLADPYTIFERDGVKIAVIGVVTPNITAWDKENLDGYKVTTPSDEINTAIKEIGNKADVFVVAAHMDLIDELGRVGSGVESMAKACPDVDLICAAHGHNIFAETLESGIPATENVNEGKTISISDISLIKKDGKWDVTTITVDVIETESYEPDEDIVRLLEPYHDCAREDMLTVIGYLSGGALVEPDDITGIPNALIKSTRLISFINEVIKHYADSDISAVSLLKKDSNVQEGEIKKLDVSNIYPYENTLVKLKMNGKQLKKWMEWAASGYRQSTPEDLKITFSSESRVYNFDVFSGIKYEINISKPVGERIENLTWPDGTPVKDEDEFTVATTDYRMNSALMTPGVIFDSKQELPVIIDPAVKNDIGPIRSLILDYIRNVKNGEIDPENEGNWKITGTNNDPEIRKVINELIEAGKIQISDPKKSRTINTVPVTQKEIDEAKKQ